MLEPSEGLDPSAGADYVGDLADTLARDRARTLYYDARDIAVIDPVYFAWLVRLERGCSLFGIRLVVVHMRPETAYALSRSHPGAPPFACASAFLQA